MGNKQIDVGKIYKYRTELDALFLDPDTDPKIKDWLSNNWLKYEGKDIWEHPQPIQFALTEQAYDIISSMINPKLRPKSKKEEKKKDTFRYIIPKSMVDPKYLKHINVAGDTLFFNKSEKNELEKLVGRRWDGEKFTLKPDDKIKYNQALVNFKDNLENELWDDVEIHKNTLTAIRPEISDSLNSVISVAKNPKIPQAKKNSWLTKAWGNLKWVKDKVKDKWMENVENTNKPIK